MWGNRYRIGDEDLVEDDYGEVYLVGFIYFFIRMFFDLVIRYL